MIHLIDRIASALARVTLWLAAVLLLLMAFHVTADVISRSVFNAPIAATLEFGTYYYMVAASFLALGYAQMRDHNVSVDILIHGAGPRMRMVVECVALIVTLIYGVAFTWASTLSALEKTRVGAYTLTQFFNLATWPSHWILVVAGVVFCLVLLAQILRIVAALGRGEDRRVAELIGQKIGQKTESL